MASSSSPRTATATATAAVVSTNQREAEEQEQIKQRQQQQAGSTLLKCEEEEEATHNCSIALLQIDGAMGEGGGQLLRNAISLATLLQRPMTITNIRAGRSKPGLQAQHLASLQLPVEICGGSGRPEIDEQFEQKQQQLPSHAAKRQKDNGNDNDNGTTMMSSSSIPNNDPTSTTNGRLPSRRRSRAVPFLTGDTLHSREIHFQPPPPPPEQIHKNNEQENEQHQQRERIITQDIGTAGSICLLLQAALPCAIFQSLQSSPPQTLQLHLHGGTNATMAPQYDYWERVFLPTLQEQCGFFHNNHHSNNVPNGWPLLPSIHARVIRRGYFPRGGGHVCITIQPPPAPAASATTTAAPSAGGADTTTTTTANVTPPGCYLQPIQLTERGQVQQIYIRSFHAGRLPRHLAETMAVAAEKLVRQTFPSSRHGRGRGRGHAPPQQQQQHHLPNQHHHSQQQQQQQRPTVEIVVDIVTESEAVGSGLGILVVATTTTGCRLAGSALSDPKKKAAEVGRVAAQELLDTLRDGGCVDEWLQDQLILYMALAKGVSEIKTGSLTLHTRTAIEIAQLFCGAKCFEIHKLGSGDAEDTGSKVCSSNDSSEKKKATSKGLCNGQNEISHSRNVVDESYGLNGRIAGHHLIRCHGIGHTVSPL